MFGVVHDVSLLREDALPFNSTILYSFPLLMQQTKYMTAEDVNIGIGAILETFEMM